ncbi:unnamed protein product [Cylindrotheca closterium]|uniref:Uncharacterized protein n=1 Tax=Cylindrotheca closterium TaxID=2856 RepID=A0AAD2FL89_9STRA|nr:unnamed protein product [Cylindrotheca closterium]
MEQQSRKRSRPPSPYPQGEARNSPSKSGDGSKQKKHQEPKEKRALAAVTQENKRLRAHRANIVENERLKAEIDALSKCNLEKVEEMASLKNNISTLQKTLGTSSEEIALLMQITTTTLPTDLAAAEQRMHDIHDSWREQVTQLGEKQSQVDSLRHELQQVQEEFQKDTQNLIQERQERKRLQGRLDELRKAYESQGKAAQWHNILRGSVAMATMPPTAIKKDCG